MVAKKFVLSLESLSSLGFEERNLGCPGNFAGMSRTPGGVQKVCAKKVRAHFSCPKVVEDDVENAMEQGWHIFGLPALGMLETSGEPCIMLGIGKFLLV